MTLKVVHLNASSSGGAFQVAQRLNIALNEQTGVQSNHLVFTGKNSSAYTLWSNSWFRRKRSFFLHALEKLDFLRFEKSSDVRFSYSHAKTGISILNNRLVKEADIVHLHWINKGFLSLDGLRDLLKSDKKIIWTAHDMWPFTGGCYYSGSCKNYLNNCANCKYLKNPNMTLSTKMLAQKKQIFEHSSIKFITPSQWLKSIGEASIPGLNVTQVYNGINTDLFKPNLGGNGGANFTVAFAAASLADKRKGLVDFMKIIPELHKEIPHLKILFIGNQSPDLKVPDAIDVEFTGFISDETAMKDLYNRSDVYVNTSHEDNLPTTIMESLSCGTPVFSYGVGGVIEMVSSDRGGLVDDGDYKGLAKKIISYHNLGKDEQNKLGLNARKFALANFDIEEVARLHLEVYKA